ncbi:Sir2 family NAD-dependent protein deacetylase [Lactobacillus sp. ESL0791]|uniref:Sir2 family NAD-dependent protein deacetylase n=1 Tax=Lactobacillus sp. ESL0791 TaxID=2983234 RepID=UPI0023F9A610|nr:Sir2 family NAD-dependent protein deacetylase [Lactobacillus sp. ESL0791]MDF7638345.1 Sir2 family NAD-dependent protein deacetylase [Lactobacillus sp. ESL0791]
MTKIKHAQQLLAAADAVIVTAGNGFAKAEGLDILSSQDFAAAFPELAIKYDVRTIGDALDQKFASWNEAWAVWSQLISKYSHDYQPSQAMAALKIVLQGKEYFIATSTFGHFFENAGFNPKRIFNAFGDWTKMQCSSGINHGLYDDGAVVSKIMTALKAGKQVTDEFVPKCPKCGQPLELHMPLTPHFFPDTDANTVFRWFLTGHEEQKLVFLELGVDETSPQLAEPIVKLVEQYPTWSYVAADFSQEALPDAIQERAVGLDTDLTTALTELAKE